MPFYDLRCTACNTEHNISASMKDKSDKAIPCPDCGSFDLETIFKSPPAFVKGRPSSACPGSGGCGYSCPHAM